MRARFAHTPRRAVLCIAVVSLLAAACSAGAEEAVREPAPAPSDASLISSEGAPVSEFPAEVVNSWGVTTFLKAGEPYDPPDGVGGMTTVISPMRPSLDDWQLGRSHAIVIGTVIDISPGHYNSVDGGFWYEPTYARRTILQDVTIEVERVLGDTAELTEVGGALKKSIVVTIWSGQLEVTFDESLDPASLPENVEPGDTFVESVNTTLHVAEGDRVLVFLLMQMRPWFGAPVDPEMPWAQQPVEPCSDQPVGTKVVVYGSWLQLGAADQQLTVQDRMVTFDELEALADAGLGQSLEDPSAPIGPGNGSRSLDDHPPPLCYTRHPPAPPPDHTHPEYED